VKVLVGCEFSGRVRDAFRAHGHDAWSCDLLESDPPSEFHIVADVRGILHDGWDLAIFHPPCDHLAVSGARWWTDHVVKRKKGGDYFYDGSKKRAAQEAALAFVLALMEAPIPRIAVENPISVISTRIRPPDQIIQPWMFGDPYQKATCLWLKNLPLLVATNEVEGRTQAVWRATPSPDRWKLRSLTYPGIAQAMAVQWGSLSPLVVENPRTGFVETQLSLPLTDE